MRYHPHKPHKPRRRPPWWPQDEAWPPADPAQIRALREMRRNAFRRIGVLMLVFAFLFWGLVGIGIWSAAVAFGLLNAPLRGLGNFILPLVLIFVGLTMAVRALRGAAAPIGDLMEAAGRVAEGDYSVRVPETGPREVRSLARAFNLMSSRLQSNDEQRRNLLADVTHELRTPLTVIQGNLEGLIDGVYPRDDAHLVPVLEETHVLSRLIDDLRTLALAESGALKLQREPTDLAAVTTEAAASFRAQADTAGVELCAEVAADLPLIELDAARIRQVLDNLVANALRYTPRGGKIALKCFAQGAGAARRVAIAVSDNGKGIAPEELPHIFERFFKSRDSGGTGLGLAIAKNLVAAHGGEISAQSQPGQGTTIQFSFPVMGGA